MDNNNDELIIKLEQATEGSRELDVMIFQTNPNWERTDTKGWSKVAGGRNIVKDEAFAPLYTSSLDAKPPGENIVRVQFDPIENDWIAWHSSLENKSTRGIAKTEALARRVASLKARK